MGLFDKIKKQNDNYDDFAGDSEYYGDSYDEAETMAEETAAPAPTPVEPAAFGATASLKIVNPKSYKDAAEIADFLMNGNTILLNIEGLAPDQAIRLLDYLAGATHAVLSGPACERLEASAIEELVLLNTVPLAEEKKLEKMTFLSVAPLFAEAISRVFTNGTVSELFDK